MGCQQLLGAVILTRWRRIGPKARKHDHLPECGSCAILRTTTTEIRVDWREADLLGEMVRAPLVISAGLSGKPVPFEHLLVVLSLLTTLAIGCGSPSASVAPAVPSPTARVKPTATPNPTAVATAPSGPKPVATAVPTRPAATAVPTRAPASPIPASAIQPPPAVTPIRTATAIGSDPCQPGQIKGNRNSKIYHIPGGQFYEKTYQNVQCFETEAQAVAAGYRRAQR